MKKFAIFTGIVLTTFTTIQTPAQAAQLNLGNPVNYLGEIAKNQTAWINFDVLPADPSQGSNSEYEYLGKNYLSLGITNLGEQVRFTLKNDVPSSAKNTILNAAIEAIYIEDTQSLLKSFTNFSTSSGVNFKTGAKPDEIPNALNAYPTEFTSNFSFQAINPLSTPKSSRILYAIDRGESLELTFDLASGKTIDDIFNQMDKSNFRVGINVVGLGSNKYESATYQNVPEPITLLGSGVALGFGSLLKRRGKKPSV